VGYRLRMSGEIHDWLADLHDSDPAAAMLTGQALAALISEGASLGPPLVLPAAVTWPEDLAVALDVSYQDRLERLQLMRRRAAEAAWLVRDMKDQIDVLESAQARLDDRRRHALEAGREEEAAKAAGRLAAVQQEAAQARQLLPWITETETWLDMRLRRLQARIDAFRTKKELLKARYTAARAELQVNEEVADPDAAGPKATAEAAARLRDITAEIERELGRQPLLEGLLELRPGAPDGEIRLIFAVEPPGTALLIAVLEGREAARDQYRDAVTLSADMLLEARAGQAPEASVHGYDDTPSFVEEFFPGQAAEIDAGAAALVARNRAHTLAEQRTRFGLTQTELAERMGVPAEHVAAIERAEPGTTDVRTLASYVEALGGRLEIIADFAGDRVVLR
jgi:phage shock protein A/DNA-binding XRE family transcriptional regulator